MGFTEETLENLICDEVASMGYEHVKGEKLNREYEDVLIESDLRTFLKNRYAKKFITNAEIDRIILGLKTISSSPLFDANKAVYKLISEGQILVRDDKSQDDFFVQLIDFDNPDNNIFKICNQVIIQGPQEKRIPDAIVYINGLPLVVWEFKSTVREEADIHDAYVQITTRYTRDIPELFKYNAFSVISDGINSRFGSIFAPYEHFNAWRKANDNDEEVDGIASLYTMINGLFPHDRIIEMIHNFIMFGDTGNVKIVANYPQYFAVTKLYKSVLEHRMPKGNGKGGTYFGTTGSGKSYAMVFLTRKLMRSSILKSPTIILIVDRTDLDDQLSATFQNAKTYIGETDIASIDSRDDLFATLKDKPSGGVFITTIQKFTEDFRLLSDRNNIICISDEAHRSQTNLDQNQKIVNGEYKTGYGYAKYLHDSFPNATFVGFTGTPLQETIDVFGNIVESYTMKDSIRDGITVRLVYDGRFAKAVLDSNKLKEIEDYYDNCLKEGANTYQVEESKKKSVSILSIMGADDILHKIAQNFIEHYENRVKEGSTVAGKAMFLAQNRQIAWKFYNIVKSMRPEWTESKKHPDNVAVTEKEERKLKPMPMIKVIATRSKDDPKDMWEALGDDKSRSDALVQFKDINSNFKIAICVDMWTTGVDIPFMDTIYIFKMLMQPHNIIQTISRVNRAYPGKECGLIVDFIGIKTGINKALKKYAKFDSEELDGVEQAISIVHDQLDVLDNMMYKFDSSLFFNGNGMEKLLTLNKAAEFIQAEKKLEQRFMAHVKRMSRAFNLCNASKDFTDSELDKIHYYIAVRSVIFKLNKGKAPDIHTMNETVRKMVEDAISSTGVEEIFNEQTDMNMKEIDLFDKKYLEKIDKIELPNTKVKVLQQLLEQEIDKFKKVNKIKAVTFSERLQAIVDNYNSRSLTDSEAKEIIKDTAEKLMKLAEDMKTEQNSFSKLGITYEEKAFYDVLKNVEDKYDFTYSEEGNKKLAKDIHKLVTDKTKYVDWENRDDVKAEMQADIIELLYNNDYPQKPDGTLEDYEKVYNDVINQAENFRKYYNV